MARTTRANRKAAIAHWQQTRADHEAQTDAEDGQIVTVAQVLTESSADVWRRWALDRDIRRAQRKLNAQQEAREAANLPIYPVECAQRIAQDAQTVAPDWRHMRPTLGPAWGRLLKAQPELAKDLTEQREHTITAVFNSVPKHLQATVNDLRTLIDLLLMAHEAAAYHVGYEAGRLVAHTHVDERGRIRSGHKPARSNSDHGQNLPAGKFFDRTVSTRGDTALRLGLDTEGGR